MRLEGWGLSRVGGGGTQGHWRSEVGGRVQEREVGPEELQLSVVLPLSYPLLPPGGLMVSPVWCWLQRLLRPRRPLLQDRILPLPTIRALLSHVWAGHHGVLPLIRLSLVYALPDISPRTRLYAPQALPQCP